MSALEPVWEVLARYDSLSAEEKIDVWAGVALAEADSIHHFIHGKEKGATMADCTDEICHLLTALRAKVI